MAEIDVFVSYNRRDLPFVQKLADRLRIRGVRPWLDVERLPPGQAWNPAIRNIIKTAPAALFFIGIHGLGRWQERELRLCLVERRRGLALLPVILPDTPEHVQLPWTLRELNWLSIKDELSDPEIETLISSLRTGTQGNTPRTSSYTQPTASESVQTAKRDDKSTYLYTSLIRHLYDAHAWSRLFELVETKHFLAHKADFFATFQPILDDLEIYVIPAAIATGNWNRFLLYTLISNNLRNLSENLGEPRVFALLLANGQQSLAEDLARRSPAALRPEMYAAIAAELSRDDPQYSKLLRVIVEDIASLPAPRDLSDAKARTTLLAKVVFYLGLEFIAPHERFLKTIEAWPEFKSSIWIAAAQGYLARGIELSYFWEAVRRIDNSQALVDLLPRSVLEASEPLSPYQLLEDLEFLPIQDDAVFWYTWMASLARQARYDPQGCMELWHDFTSDRRVPWSPELVELGRDFLSCFPPAEIEELYLSMDPLARVTLRTVILEANPDLQKAEAAYWSLQDLPWNPGRIHWTLRYLLARPSEPVTRTRSEALSTLRRLSSSLESLSSLDLARVLDVTSRYLPKEVSSQLRLLAKSRHLSARFLEIAGHSRSIDVLETIRLHANELADDLAPAASRQRIYEALLRLTNLKICCLWGDAASLGASLSLLDAKHADELCAEVAEALALKGYLQQAREACDKIKQPSLRLRTFLSVLPPDLVPPDLLTPRKLYEAAASTRLSDREVALFTDLARNTAKQDYVRRYLVATNERGEHPRDASFHFPLRFQKEVTRFVVDDPEPDPARHLRQIRKALIDLHHSRLSDARFHATQILSTILMMSSISWPAKRQVIEWLLAMIEEVNRKENVSVSTHRLLAQAVESIARLPSEILDPEIRKVIQADWHEVFPLLIAFVERQPEQVRDHLRVGLVSSLESLSRRLRRKLSNAPDRTSDSPNTFVLHRWARHLVDEGSHLHTPLPPKQLEMIELCLGDTEAREWKARSLLFQTRPDLPVLRACALLLTRDRPQLVELIASRWMAPESRDDLCLSLIRSGACPRGHATTLSSFISDPATSLEARIWLDLQSSTDDFSTGLACFAQLVSDFGIDPVDPSFQTVFYRIWAEMPKQATSHLAESVQVALRGGDRQRREAALVLWLHAFLAAERNSGNDQALQEVSRCILRSLTL
jgi:hypothetical protein